MLNFIVRSNMESKMFGSKFLGGKIWGANSFG